MKLDEYTGRRSPAALAAGQQVLNVIVEHLDFKRVFDSSIDLVDTMLSLKMPSGILIQADPGMGKTLLLQMIKKRLSESDAGKSKAACLEIRLDSGVDTPQIAGAVMLALGYPMLPSRPNLQNMNHLISKGLTRLKPQVLLIDEMQHVCEGNRDITARAVTDWLKVRMDAFNLPVIGTGTRTLERLSVINPQFTSRASASFVLAPFEFGESWRQLLAGFAVAVLAVDLEIINGPMARLIHTATRGNLRALKKLLTYAVMHAAERAEKKVSVDDFARANDDANGHALGRANPFSAISKGGA